MAAAATLGALCSGSDRRADLSALVQAYRGSGFASYHPAALLGLMVYGYATKTFSSRAIVCATYDSVAFRFIAVNEHPDHDTIAAFRTMQFQFPNNNSEVSHRRSTDIATPTCAQFEFYCSRPTYGPFRQ